tara:strand:- start:1336 stop:2229 length:894 start_codon:yes stop_codon:yes gene_type:complete
MFLLSGFTGLLGLLLVITGLIGLIFKRLRRRAKKAALLGIFLFVVGSVGITKYDPAEEEATEKGFASATQMREALREGFETPAEFEAHQQAQAEEAVAKERAEAEEAAAKEQTRLDAAKAAGFPNIDTADRARAAGIETMAGWSAYLAAQEREAALQIYKDAIGRNLIAIKEVTRMDGSALELHIKPSGLTNSLDFYGIGQDVGDLAKALRKPPAAPYQTVIVMVSVDTIDKYGNPAGLAEAAVLTWDMVTLAKVNLDFGPDFLFRNARDVELTRFGRELATAYCQDHDLRDPRYCQ